MEQEQQLSPPPPRYDELEAEEETQPLQQAEAKFKLVIEDADAGSRRAGAAADGMSVHSASSRSSDDDSNPIEPVPVGQWCEERSKRETWSGQLDFILSCIGYAVGLGNIWRFPYLCYKNGGGAFLIPYFIFLVLCGMPMTMLELCVGQFVSLGPTALFQKFCPLFQGLGWSMVLISAMCCIYYNMIIAWTLYYLLSSVVSVFTGYLPWTLCDVWWTDERCVGGMAFLSHANVSHNDSRQPQTASEQYFSRYVLKISSGIGEMGELDPALVVSLLAAWLVIYACLFKGVQSSGRVVYVTATFPYVVLVILMFRGLTLPGAWNGIYYYLVPDFKRLLELEVWVAAASQIFYSQGAAWGVMFTFASFNKFRHNCYRDALVIPIINCGTSLFAGVVVFSIIGFMAETSQKEVKDVITSGPGLTFIVYPEAVASLPISPLWAILFFLMLLTIGVDSQFGMFETFITAIVDTWPKVLRKRKSLFTAAVCVAMFVLGLIFCTHAGMFVLQLMDWYSAAFSLMIVGVLECLLLNWNYGYRRVMVDIQLMVGRRPSIWWPICWGVITPLLIGLLLLASLVLHKPVTYGEISYPPWAVALGWGMAAVSIVPIPLFFIKNFLFDNKGSVLERLAAGMRPTPDWGPSRLGDRVAFRKSFSQAPSKQLYVMGVEKQEMEMEEIIKTRPSAANLGSFIEEVHIKGSTLDVDLAASGRF